MESVRTAKHMYSLSINIILTLMMTPELILDPLRSVSLGNCDTNKRIHKNDRDTIIYIDWFSSVLFINARPFNQSSKLTRLMFNLFN